MSSLRTNFESSTFESPVEMRSQLPAVAESGLGNAPSSPYVVPTPIDFLHDEHTVVALIGPDEERRRELVGALAGCKGAEIHAFASYPPSLDDTPQLLELHHDVIIIELDSDPEFALDLVESIGANSSKTVMVYSAKTDPQMVLRCMRAGAREYLTPPFDSGVLAESLLRAAARRSAAPPVDAGEEVTLGKLVPFIGAKGGTGVTTLACNFAVALAQESEKKTLLIDLDLPLGDVALNLGITPEYTTIDALQSADRLDSSLLSRFVVKHSSGLSVLPSPGKFHPYQLNNADIDKLLLVAQQSFENVVVDVGSRIDLNETSLFKSAFAIYLVTQAGIPELRNSNRFISEFSEAAGSRLKVVVNRCQSGSLSVSDADITKALTRPAEWKISNDYAAVRQMQINATPLALGNSAISRQIREMARSLTGKPVARAKKKGFSLFG